MRESLLEYLLPNYNKAINKVSIADSIYLKKHYGLTGKNNIITYDEVNAFVDRIMDIRLNKKNNCKEEKYEKYKRF